MGDQLERLEPDDRVQVLREVAEEHQAFFLGYALKILRAARMKQPTGEDAREIVQDAYLSALRAFHAKPEKKFPNGDEPSFEFCGYIRNSSLSFLRARKRRDISFLDMCDNVELDEIVAGCRSDELLRIHLRKCVESLEEADQWILELAVEGHNSRDMQELLKERGLHMSRGAIRKRKSRLLQTLRKLIED